MCHWVKPYVFSYTTGPYSMCLTHWPLGVFFKLILVTDVWAISCEIAHKWMSLNLTDDKSTLVRVKDWCRQATSHYLSQCWPRSMSPYGASRPQWLNFEVVPSQWDHFLKFAIFTTVVLQSWIIYFYVGSHKLFKTEMSQTGLDGALNSITRNFIK